MKTTANPTPRMVELLDQLDKTRCPKSKKRNQAHSWGINDLSGFCKKCGAEAKKVYETKAAITWAIHEERQTINQRTT
jgi:rubrerythrin